MDKATAGPAVHRRMTYKYLLVVFGPPRHHALCSPRVIFPLVRPSKTCFIVLACRGFWKTRLIRVLWDVPKKIQTPAAQPRTGWALADFCILGSPCRKRTFLLVGNADSRDSHRIARICAGTDGRCSVSGRKKFTLQSSLSRSDRFSSRDNTRAPKMSFALAMTLTMNARRFQRTHTLTGMRSSLSTSKDTGMGNIYIAHICASESMMDAVRVTVVGSACAGLELDAGSGHNGRSSNVCSVGDTRWSLSICVHSQSLCENTLIYLDSCLRDLAEL